MEISVQRSIAEVQAISSPRVLLETPSMPYEKVRGAEIKGRQHVK